ncbi:peptide chain release factor N(5)-glutamine methyltransferase [Schaalia sp. 19OD2882]|uniref:peptide chain release factor N(5)-glutamine methyltransferase n=1 Tax=Schaalia sp. 19OD2882 TaxID=2794089 RepID=UPI001C1F076C|nr:peptide chain release factor N(5)-glutamine methyltransferase [Schaalia sp. 19OD2882]QWW20355.1 peptide chain release factor N(5)-glutamine methyltransferase [Schaalia sp. 19OD2882]
MNAGATQQELLAKARAALAHIEGANAHQEARILLEWAMGADDLWTAPATLTRSQERRFHEALARRCAREPLQHVVGRMWFRDLTLVARPGVFVTRPETEVVAGCAIDEAARLAGESAGQGRPGPLVVDLCAGSGAIAIAVATEVPSARVVAVEIDEDAADLARTNIDALAPGRVDLVVGDATSRSTLDLLEGGVDVVVSNPPYVPDREPVTQAEALVDPERALYGGGEDGMVVPRGIVEVAWHLLAPGALLVVEHASSQSREMRREARQRGYAEVRTLPDLTGRDRLLHARRPLAPPPWDSSVDR